MQSPQNGSNLLNMNLETIPFRETSKDYSSRSQHEQQHRKHQNLDQNQNHHHHLPVGRTQRDKVPRLITCGLRFALVLVILVIAAREDWLTSRKGACSNGRRCLILVASGHIVLTRDDRGQSLVLTGEDGKGGKGGKGKGKGSGGDRLVIAGNMGGGQNSNMVLQDAANREGDVVISGKSMVIPGEDGHIVLADNRAGDDGNNGPRGPQANLFALWMPYIYGRMGYRMPMQYFGNGGWG